MKKLASNKAALVLTMGIILLFVVSAGYLLLSGGKRNAAMIAEVWQNGVMIRSIPLTSETADFSFTVKGEGDAINVIEVRGGRIAVTSASCPDKLCVGMGFHDDSLLPITCLPNHLVIRIRPLENGESADAVTY